MPFSIPPTAAVAAAATATAFPSVLRAADKAGTKNAVVGSGEHTYECRHGWGETHGVAVDSQGFIHIKNNTGSSGLRHQDCIVVFDPDGKFVRSFGNEHSAFNIHTVGHGIDIRKEGGTEYLFATPGRTS